MRPSVFQVGGTIYWVLQTRNPDTMVLKDADSTPTVAVRKNGASVGDSVTVTKRSATTGIYDCSYNPAGEAEGDSFTIEESATVTGTTTSSATYTQTWNARVIAVERGTDGANTTAPPTVSAVADEVQTRTIARVTLVDTCSVNSDMRGTNDAMLAASYVSPPSAATISTQVAADLLAAHGSGSWTTATGFSTPTNVSDTETAILARLPAALESGRIAAVLDSATVAKIDDILTDELATELAHLNADITSRSSHSAVDVSNTLLGKLKATYYAGTGQYVLWSKTEDGSEIASASSQSSILTAIGNLKKSGYSYAGTTLVVDGDETATYSMTQVSITPPATPGLSAIVVLCLDAAGQPEPDVDIDIRIVTVPSGSTNTAFKGAKQTATSDADGIARLCSGTVSAESRYIEWIGAVVDYDTLTTLNAVHAKVDAMDARLPSDPADQSQLEVYIDGAVASIQGSQQSAAAAAIAAYDPPTNAEMVARTLPAADYATATGLTAVLTKIRKFFQLALRKDAAIATDNATELTELNANGGTGGGGYLNTTDSQEATVDRGNAAWTTGGGSGGAESALMLSTTIASVTSQNVLVLTEGTAENDAYNGMLVVFTDSATATQKARAIVSGYVGSSKTLTLANSPTFEVASGDSIAIIAVGASGTTAVTLTLGATIPLEIGEVTGLTEPLVIGDDYTEEVGRRIPITLTDANGDAVAVTYGTHSLATDCSIKMLFQPEGRNTTRAAITGTCTFVAAVGETPAFLWLTLPRSETTKASPATYDTHVEARWTDGFNVTLGHKGKAKFTRDIQRVG